MSGIMDGLLNQARKATRDPRECLKTIAALGAIGFFDDGGDAFKELHHQGGSVTAFSNYSGGIEEYEEDDNNHRVHQRLKYVLLSCPNGAPPNGKSFLSLATEAKNEIRPIVKKKKR